MEVFLIRALQLILCLSLLIILHEGGHFFFAKLFKVRVERFCLFFNPWKTLLRYKPKNSDTEYCLGWIPLGGYVTISGMIDESMNVEQMKQEPKPWEFRSHPAWQRLLIMLGGVLVNFLVALVLYAMVLFVWGRDYVPLKDMTMGMQWNTEAKALGFQDHDILLSADGKELSQFNSTESISDTYRALSCAKTVNVLRNGKETTIQMPAEGLNLLNMFRAEQLFLCPYIPARIDSVLPESAAAKAGIVAGDQLVAFNGQALETWADYNYLLNNLGATLVDATTADSLAARHVTVVVAHADAAQPNDTLALTMDSEFHMGVVQASVASFYDIKHYDYGFFESIPAGISYGTSVLSGYVSDLKYLFTKEGAKSVGSFGAIGSMFPKAWDWKRFWELTAFISIILAFMNVLPIPALDGGHVLFLLVEIVTRRKPSDKFMERAQVVGMALLIALMVFALGNDIFKFLIN